MTPEHLHLAINHIPVIGLACAILPLLIGLLAGSRGALISGLILAAVCGWSMALVMYTGEEAYERYEEPREHGIVLDKQAQHWLHEHEERAENLSLIIYGTAALSMVTLLLALLRSKWAFKLTWLVVLLCVASLAAGIYIARSGGMIRRPDFRPEQADARMLLPEHRAQPLHGFHDVVA